MGSFFKWGKTEYQTETGLLQHVNSRKPSHAGKAGAKVETFKTTSKYTKEFLLLYA